MNKKYIFITKHLDRIEKVKKESSMKFYSPNAKYGKYSRYENLLDLLEKEKNIACTYKLFMKREKEVTDLIEKYNYTLILDKGMEEVEKRVLSKDDFRILKNQKLIEVKDNQIYWIDDTYDTGIFLDFKHSCLNGENVFIVTDMICLFPTKDKIKEYLENIIDKPLIKKEQEELIKKINLRDNYNRLQKCYSAINVYLENNYNLHIKRERPRINGKQTTIWKIIK